jgi:epoxyqueuosine reductase QueG
MAAKEQKDSMQGFVLFYAAAALVALSLLSGCSTFSTESEEVPAELSQSERLTELKQRLLETHHKLHMQRAELKKLINNDAELELLLRMMYVKKQKNPLPDAQENDAKNQLVAESNEVDYLQRMVANQVAIKSDLAKLLQEINTMSAGTSP